LGIDEDRAWLLQAARDHLQRYPCSRSRLVTVLRRRVARRRPELPLEALLSGVLDQVQEEGLLDDPRLARCLVEGWVHRGRSRRDIGWRLMGRGLGAEQAEALAGVDAEREREACRVAVRRKGLGPQHLQDPKRLASLARLGFPLDLVREVLREAEGQPA
jgi:SOS response regulatory protein OraA/RecX